MADYLGTNPEYIVQREHITQDMLLNSLYKPRKGAFILKEMALVDSDANPFLGAVESDLNVELTNIHTDMVYNQLKFTSPLPELGVYLTYRYVDSTFQDALVELEELLKPERVSQTHYNKVQNKPSIHKTPLLEYSLFDINNAEGLIAALLTFGLSLKRSKYTANELAKFLESFNLLTRYQTKEDPKLYTNNILIPEAINELYRTIDNNRSPKGNWIAYGGEINESVDLSAIAKPFDFYWFVNVNTTVIWEDTVHYLSKGDRVYYDKEKQTFTVIDNGSVRTRLESDLQAVIQALANYQDINITLANNPTTVTNAINMLVDMLENATSNTTAKQLLAQTFTTNFPTNLSTDAHSISSIQRFASFQLPIDVQGYWNSDTLTRKKVYPGDVVFWDKVRGRHYVTSWGATREVLSNLVSVFYSDVDGKVLLDDVRLNTMSKNVPTAINELLKKVQDIPNPEKNQGLELQWGGLSQTPVIDAPKSTSYIYAANSNISFDLNLVNRYGGNKALVNRTLIDGDIYFYDGVNNCNYLLPAATNYKELNATADDLKVIQDKHLLDIQPSLRTGKVSTLLPLLEKNKVSTQLATHQLLKRNEVVFNPRSNDLVSVLTYLYNRP